MDAEGQVPIWAMSRQGGLTRLWSDMCSVTVSCAAGTAKSCSLDSTLFFPFALVGRFATHVAVTRNIAMFRLHWSGELGPLVDLLKHQAFHSRVSHGLLPKSWIPQSNAAVTAATTGAIRMMSFLQVVFLSPPSRAWSQKVES